MATVTEAPATTPAEGPTPHTPNQAPFRRLGALSDLQIAWLLKPVDPDRVAEDDKGFSHMEAWDIKRHLIRVFGFGGHDIDLLDVTLISERSQERRDRDRNGQEVGDPYEVFSVIYRVSVKLTVKVDGIELGHWTGVATGDATDQTSLADAHDLALKTADSQALKRAAINLGDGFGLSLYNQGRLTPVVQVALPYWKAPEDAAFDDSKVEADPQTAAARKTTPAEPESGPSQHLAKLIRQTADCKSNLTVLKQIKADGETHQVLDEQYPTEDGTQTTLRTVLDDLIAKFPASNRRKQRSA